MSALASPAEPSQRDKPFQLHRPLVGALWNGVARAGILLSRMAAAWRHRRELSALAGFDERALGDIGLTRSDVRDALSQSWLSDPSELLASRRDERRDGRPYDLFGIVSPPLASEGTPFRRLPTDRPSRYTV